MSTRKLAIIFVLCFATAALAVFPLPAALRTLDLDASGLAYSRATGTVWNGEITGLSWRGQPLGDATVALKPAALFLGRLGMEVAVNGAAATGQGFIALTIGGIIADDLTLSANVADLPLLLPLTGKVALDLDFAALSRGGCRRIEGTINTDALVHRPAGLPWRGPELGGSIACVDGAIAIPLKGESESDSVTVALTLDPDGAFGVRIDARTPNQALLSALSAVGFKESDGVMTLTQKGRWS